jgi:predicted glycogen debranching enzyme
MQQTLVHLGREICGDPAAALRREWMVTNGLGGYASTALDGTPVRRYSGWLIAALRPPVARTVLVGGLLETATTPDGIFALGSLEHAGGGLRPDGGRHLEAFDLEGSIPAWTYALGAARLERRAWMAHGRNTTHVRYTLSAPAPGPVDLVVTPLVTFRDHHELAPMDWRRPALSGTATGDGIEVRWPGVTIATRLIGPGAAATPQPEGTSKGWMRGLGHRVETERGLDDVSDLAVPGAFRVRLAPGDSWTLVLTVEADEDVERDGERALAAARERDAALLAQAAAAGTDVTDPLVARLVLAADQFIVERPVPGESTPGRSIIAGYPWFNDWSRDTMIALPGLALATGRLDDATRILRSFAPWIRDGLLPNSFPDSERTDPSYHCVDGPLWYIHAIDAHARAAGNEALVDELLPVARSILDAYANGTGYGIGMDPADGLIHEGAPGVQLTWMDAKAGDWVVTPRRGKPVEIQALWIHGCRLAARWCEARGLATPYAERAARAAASFRARFFDRSRGYCVDVVDGPDGESAQLRPNQLFAISLEPDLLAPEEAAAVVDTCTRALWVGCGLRSLASGDPEYVGAHTGDRTTRDSAYHQGTAWTWLIGPWAEASLRTGVPNAVLRERLRLFEDHLSDGALGSIAECLDGDPPHRPTACHSQAWSVAELLRVVRLVDDA